MFVFYYSIKKSISLANDFNTKFSKLVRQVEESGGLDQEWQLKIFQVKFKLISFILSCDNLNDCSGKMEPESCPKTPVSTEKKMK